MASFEVHGLGELILSAEEVAQMGDDVADDILNAQADVVVAAQQAKARTYGVQDTGLVIDSIAKGEVKKTKDGRAIYIYPRGSRTRNGKKTRNAEIAFVNEFGKKNQKARPFVRDATEQCAPKTEEVGAAVFDAYLKSKNL